MKLSRDQKTMLGLGVLALLAVFVFWAATSFSYAKNSSPAESPQIVALREIVAKAFADPDAEMTEVSSIVSWRGKDWRHLQVRFVNAMGGRVFSSYFVAFDQDVPEGLMNEKDFHSMALDMGEAESFAVAKAFDDAEIIDARVKKKAAH